MIRRTLFLGLLIAGAALPAHASTISFTGVGNAEVVTVGVKTGTTTEVLSGWAGELNWVWNSGQGTRDIYTYCVDLLHYAQSVQTVDAVGTDSLSTVASNGAQKAAWLFNTFAAGVNAAPNVDYLGAGLQLAIWEVLYDNNFALTGSGAGNFWVVSASSLARTAANNYLTALTNVGSAYLSADALLLDVPGGIYLGQDQITFAPVPEPASLLLFGTGLAVLVARHRKKLQRG